MCIAESWDGEHFFCLGSKSPSERLPREVCLWWWWGKDGPTSSHWFVMFFGIQDVVNLPKGGLGGGRERTHVPLPPLTQAAAHFPSHFSFPPCGWRSQAVFGDSNGAC